MTIMVTSVDISSSKTTQCIPFSHSGIITVLQAVYILKEKEDALQLLMIYIE